MHNFFLSRCSLQFANRLARRSSAFYSSLNNARGAWVRASIQYSLVSIDQHIYYRPHLTNYVALLYLSAALISSQEQSIEWQVASFFNEYPLLWTVYALVMLLPIVLIIACIWPSKKVSHNSSISFHLCTLILVCPQVCHVLYEVPHCSIVIVHMQPLCNNIQYILV